MKKGEGLNTLVSFRNQGMQEKEVEGGIYKWQLQM